MELGVLQPLQFTITVYFKMFLQRRSSFSGSSGHVTQRDGQSELFLSINSEVAC